MEDEGHTMQKSSAPVMPPELLKLTRANVFATSTALIATVPKAADIENERCCTLTVESNSITTHSMVAVAAGNGLPVVQRRNLTVVEFSSCVAMSELEGVPESLLEENRTMVRPVLTDEIVAVAVSVPPATSVVCPRWRLTTPAMDYPCT